ncbi:MAG: DUF4197 domain-containing protein [Bacteroidales bacterium]|nr:DUF4197 domain-containing protein [Bacteroidales bacterium]
MNFKKGFLLVSFLIFTISCDITENVVKVLEENQPLTESEVVQGLKEALRVSTDTAVNIVSALNGYYGDQAIKILMPPEAGIIVDNMNNPMLRALGVNKLIDDVVIRMNRAAEDAAKTATPIFVNAIKNMTIQDAFQILNGPDTAATQYFRKKTYLQLKSGFKPKIKSSLNKPLVGNISADKAWSSLTSAYNGVAKYVPEWKQVNTQLDEYVTNKALNGLFAKLGEQEKEIRTDPVARVTEILRKVFGKK